jgi:osmotically-inducible protein OsmY
MIDRSPSLLKVTTAVSLLAWMAGCESQSGALLSSTGSQAPRYSLAAEAGSAHDELLAARLLTALKNDAVTREVEIQVSVSQRRARLSGFVDSAAAKLRAGVLAAETEGIESVENRLILRYHAGIADDPIGSARVHL